MPKPFKVSATVVKKPAGDHSGVAVILVMGKRAYKIRKQSFIRGKFRPPNSVNWHDLALVDLKDPQRVRNTKYWIVAFLAKIPPHALLEADSGDGGAKEAKALVPRDAGDGEISVTIDDDDPGTPEQEYSVLLEPDSIEDDPAYDDPDETFV